MGTRFTAVYKGQRYDGVAEKDGLVVDGKRYSSLSAAGRAITGYSVNGWTWWNCQLPDSSNWVTPDSVRRRQRP